MKELDLIKKRWSKNYLKKVNIRLTSFIEVRIEFLVSRRRQVTEIHCVGWKIRSYLVIVTI